MRRTVFGEILYKRYIKNKSSEELVKLLQEQKAVHEYDFWKIVENRFPYTVATHHLLIPKNNVADLNSLDYYALAEYKHLKKNVIPKLYDAVLINSDKARSVKFLYHEHLFKY